METQLLFLLLLLVDRCTARSRKGAARANRT
eukprot:SAG31_NODE_31441_length_368_cov_0.773234_1_plen_30_part_10